MGYDVSTWPGMMSLGLGCNMLMKPERRVGYDHGLFGPMPLVEACPH